MPFSVLYLTRPRVHRNSRFQRPARILVTLTDKTILRFIRASRYPVDDNGTSSMVVALDLGLPRSLAYLSAPAVLYLSR